MLFLKYEYNVLLLFQLLCKVFFMKPDLGNAHFFWFFWQYLVLLMSNLWSLISIIKFLQIWPRKIGSHSISKFDWNLLAETRYKILPAYEGDKQQLQWFYNACCGMAQVTPHNFFSCLFFFYSWYILKDHLDNSLFYFLK